MNVPHLTCTCHLDTAFQGLVFFTFVKAAFMSAAYQNCASLLLNFCHAGGASLETRKAAASQLAGIAASHPAQLPFIVLQVAVHLKHKEWDARVAAGHCLGLLADHFQHVDVSDLCRAAGVKPEQLGGDMSEIKTEEDGQRKLSFKDFNVLQVLDQGTPLLASWGEVRHACVSSPNCPPAIKHGFHHGPMRPNTALQEFDEAAKSESTLAKQRQNLKKRLGLGGGMDAFVDTAGTELCCRCFMLLTRFGMAWCGT